MTRRAPVLSEVVPAVFLADGDEAPENKYKAHDGGPRPDVADEKGPNRKANQNKPDDDPGHGIPAKKSAPIEL